MGVGGIVLGSFFLCLALFIIAEIKESFFKNSKNFRVYFKIQLLN